MVVQRIIIRDEIFQTFPHFYRGIIIARRLENSIAAPALVELFDAVLRSRMEVSKGPQPELDVWDEAHRKFGSNPNKHPPSIKALIKRVASGKTIPFINSVVASFNIISLKHLIPCGGDDLERITGDLVLGVAKGSETFIALGDSSSNEHPQPGEVIYFDDATKQVMCRKWNWRNSEITKIESHTRHAVINVDCLPPVHLDTAVRARDELASLLADHCNADIRVSFLDRDQRQILLD